MFHPKFIALLAMGLAFWTPAIVRADVSLELLWRHTSGVLGGAEIVAHDARNDQLLVVNGAESCITRLDIRTGEELGRLDVARFGFPTSVAAYDGLIAVAVVAPESTDPGSVLFYRMGDRSKRTASKDEAVEPSQPVAVVRVGPLPDMVVFTPDGRRVLTANEGEPNADYSLDPEGSVSVIDISGGPEKAAVLTADFIAFNLQRDELVGDGIRITGPIAIDAQGHTTVAQDLEPEYIAVAPDGRTAWVTLQENNALGIVDISAARVTGIIPLGLKNHNRPGQGLDPSESIGEDLSGRIQIRPWPVYGMYQPDGIAALKTDDRIYLVTANEGDHRFREGYNDAITVAEAPLDEALLRNNPRLKDVDQLGGLKISRFDGDVDQDGDLDRLVAFGARSLAIWSADGALVYDSGDAIEQYLADHHPDRFNLEGLGPEAVGRRSSDKGPEPEGVVLGSVGSSTYAFVGLERAHAVAIFDVTVPQRTVLVDIVPLGPSPTASDTENTLDELDLAPEGLVFISAVANSLGEPLLAVACEASGSTLLFRVRSE